MLSYEFCETFKSTFYYRTFPVVVSVKTFIAIIMCLLGITIPILKKNETIKHYVAEFFTFEPNIGGYLFSYYCILVLRYY